MDRKWGLQTTLERHIDQRFGVHRYLRLVRLCVHELESITERTWNVPEGDDLGEAVRKAQGAFHCNLPCYDYLVYLRQHGFPSPLLDWTESPFVAAYFAFREKVASDRVAIFAYVESLRGTKGLTGGDPLISVMGPHVRTHARHFAQRAWYTICTKPGDGGHEFCPHDDVFR